MQKVASPLQFSAVITMRLSGVITTPTPLLDTRQHSAPLATQLATPAEERDAAMRWWLDRFTDEEIAELAGGLGVRGVFARNVAASRTRLARIRDGSAWR